MEYFIKSETGLKKLNNVRNFLISDKWIGILFFITAVFACLHSYFPDKQFHIWGTVVLAYISGITFVISGDILTMLLPTLFTYMIAIRCYNSLSTFLGIAWALVPLIPMALFNVIAYRAKLTTKGSQFKPMMFVSVAVMLGGVGFISAKEYFALYAKLLISAAFS